MAAIGPVGGVDWPTDTVSKKELNLSMADGDVLVGRAGTAGSKESRKELNLSTAKEGIFYSSPYDRFMSLMAPALSVALPFWIAP